MKLILISIRNKTLFLYNNSVIQKSFKVAVGKPSTPTPLGSFSIKEKTKLKSSTFGTRWIRIYKSFGIHGTYNISSIGKAASHGCVRMFNKDIEELYDMVEIGTLVKIVQDI